MPKARIWAQTCLTPKLRHTVPHLGHPWSSVLLFLYPVLAPPLLYTLSGHKFFLYSSMITCVAFWAQYVSKSNSSGMNQALKPITTLVHGKQRWIFSVSPTKCLVIMHYICVKHCTCSCFHMQVFQDLIFSPLNIEEILASYRSE